MHENTQKTMEMQSGPGSSERGVGRQSPSCLKIAHGARPARKSCLTARFFPKSLTLVWGAVTLSNLLHNEQTSVRPADLFKLALSKFATETSIRQYTLFSCSLHLYKGFDMPERSKKWTCNCFLGISCMFTGF